MQPLPVEIDLWSAWYAAFSIWDSTINFWISATFAALIAAHSLQNSMTRQLARYVAWLYGSFCIYTLFRALSVYAEAAHLSFVMVEHGIQFTEFGSTMNFLSNLTISCIFLTASGFTLKFILSSAGASSSEDA